MHRFHIWKKAIVLFTNEVSSYRFIWCCPKFLVRLWFFGVSNSGMCNLSRCNISQRLLLARELCNIYTWILLLCNFVMLPWNTSKTLTHIVILSRFVRPKWGLITITWSTIIQAVQGGTSPRVPKTWTWVWWLLYFDTTVYFTSFSVSLKWFQVYRYQINNYRINYWIDLLIIDNQLINNQDKKLYLIT